MKRLLNNRHFVSGIGLAIICSSVFLFSVYNKSEAQTINSGSTTSLVLESDKVSPAAGIIKLSISAATMLPAAPQLSISGPMSGTHGMALDTATMKYYYVWDTANFPEGDYALQAKVYGTDFQSNTLPIAIKRLLINFYKPTANAVLNDSIEIKTYSSIQNANVVIFFKDGSGNEFKRMMLPVYSSNPTFNYQTGIDTKDIPNGNYFLFAEASINDQSTRGEIPVSINNISAATTNTEVTNSIRITQPSDGAIISQSGPIFISTTPEYTGTLIKLEIKGDVTHIVQAIYRTESKNYSAPLEISGLSETEYTLRAFFFKDGQTIESTPVKIRVDLPENDTVATSTTNNTDNTQTTITAPVVSDIPDIIDASPGAEILVTVNQDPLSIVFIIRDQNQAIKIKQSLPRYETGKYRFVWPKDVLTAGYYTLTAETSFPGLPIHQDSAKVNFTVPQTLTPAQPNTLTAQEPAPLAPRPAPAPIAAPAPQPIISPIRTTPQNPAPLISPTGTTAAKPVMTIPQPTTTQTYRPKPSPIGTAPLQPTTTNVQTAPTNHDQPMQIDPVCAAVGISEQIKCFEYKKLHENCRKNNIISKEECNRLRELPQPCQESGISDPAACKNHMTSIAMPPVCREAGITEQVACEKHIMANNLPTSCRNAGIIDTKSCEEHQSKTKESDDRLAKCKRIGIMDSDNCITYLASLRINAECKSALIEDPEECHAYLISSHGAKFCNEASIAPGEECESYLLNRLQSEAECRNRESWDCLLSIKENMGKIIGAQSRFARIERSLSNNSASGNVADLSARIDGIKEIMPIADQTAKVTIVPAQKRLISADTTVQTAPVLVIIDNDGDGLSDEMEERLGTDKDKADTDGDGYDDATEYRTGYNPLGQGKRDEAKKLAPVEEAIVAGMEIEHPVAKPEADGSLQSEFPIGGNVIKGKGAPLTTYSLFVYSDLPVMVTVTTDEFGNWEYRFQKSLVDGEHEVYVAINDNTGRVIERSNPLRFFIKEAKAVSGDDFFYAAAGPDRNESSKLLYIYLLVAVVTAIGGISIFVFYLHHRSKNAYEQNFTQDKQE